MLLSNGDKMLLLSCNSLVRSVLGEKIMKISILIFVCANNIAQIWGFYGTLCRAFLLHKYYVVRS